MTEMIVRSSNALIPWSGDVHIFARLQQSQRRKSVPVEHSQIY